MTDLFLSHSQLFNYKDINMKKVLSVILGVLGFILLLGECEDFILTMFIKFAGALCYLLVLNLWTGKEGEI